MRWPFLLSHLLFNILLTAFFAPLLALSIRLAVRLSGAPALSDFDIALFLLSPVGFVALLLLCGFALTLTVMNVSFMMAIALRFHVTGEKGATEGIEAVLPRARQVLSFAVRLTLRILALAGPFVLVAGVLYLLFLTEYDINYYLQNRPPEFWGVVIGAGAVLALGAALLLWRLLGWALALQMVLFAGTPPAASFRASTEAMRGKRLSLLIKLAGWGIAATLLIAAVAVLLGVVSDQLVKQSDLDLDRLVLRLLVMSVLWGIVNLVVTSLATGALAVLLMDKAGWPDARGAGSHGRIWQFGFVVAAGVAISALLVAVSARDVTQVQTADKVEIIAHRGAAGARPENTMASFEKAIEDGADWVELDVQESADGEVVVVHDSDFMKIAGNPIKVWDATMGDIAGIDIGSWFDPAYGDQRTPLLADVLLAAKDRAGVLIELKYYGHNDQLERRVADVVASTGMEDQVMSMSLKLPLAEKMKSLRPEWNVGLLSSASAGRIWALDVDFLAVNKASLTSRLVREMRQAKKKLYVWTVNEPLEMSRMVSMGVDGLITDEPALAREVVSQRQDLTSVERLVLALANRLGIGFDEGDYRDDQP
nr:glycerophosphodiester phosphodiesterase family protein [Shimia biformata]